MACEASTFDDIVARGCRVVDPSDIVSVEPLQNFLMMRDNIQVRLAFFDRKIVVVKKYRRLPDEDSGEYPLHFLWDVGTWSSLHHFNILPLLGISRLDDGFWVALSPFQPKGNLTTYIRKNPPVSMETKVLWMKEIATGLRYLHEKRVVHGDLKPDHILVDSRLHLHLCDFASSLSFPPNVSSAKGFPLPAVHGRYGTAYYMAPEQVHANHPVQPNRSTDVFAFAVCACEILADMCNVWGEESPGKDVYEERRNFFAQGRTATIHRDAPPSLGAMLTKCLQHEPQKRLAIKDIVKMLESLHKRLKASAAQKKRLECKAMATQRGVFKPLTQAVQNDGDADLLALFDGISAGSSSDDDT
ncbi:kinase-like domain-containing protein [Polychytrium aggregatum]|uniref:kinase-like domain-containing protein n=1 Tax=Polychytrium aggregatum TaxID=110093 RepID=UPI0022FE5402|nr:kinase-like domain-containing protein [Polychytrium aggregatum]KAI9192982.1 kinase-like domain-containing protein [Polychytrium aggregatum]